MKPICCPPPLYQIQRRHPRGISALDSARRRRRRRLLSGCRRCGKMTGCWFARPEWQKRTVFSMHNIDPQHILHTYFCAPETQRASVTESVVRCAPMLCVFVFDGDGDAGTNDDDGSIYFLVQVSAS